MLEFCQSAMAGSADGKLHVWMLGFHLFNWDEMMEAGEIKERVAAWLEEFGRQTSVRTGIDIRASLAMSLGRVVIKDSIKAGTLTFSAISESDIRHISDWLAVAHSENAHWLSRLDSQGRPVKLMKFGSVDQIITEADKEMDKRRNAGIVQNVGVVPDASTDVKVVHDAGDGWTIVKLMTPEALDREGHTMGHCVGQGAYYNALRNNFAGIYSLRDPFGKSHVTMEIDRLGSRLEQIKGKQNNCPKPEYLRRLFGWNGLTHLTVTRGELPGDFVLCARNGLVELSTLKPGDVIEANLELDCEFGEGFQLPFPDGVKVRGNVTIKGGLPKLTDRVELPEVTLSDGVEIDGSLMLNGVMVRNSSINANHVVFRNCGVDSLGAVRGAFVTEFRASTFRENALAHAHFQWSVEVQDCRGLKVHAGTKIGRHLSIAGCRSRSLYSSPTVSFDDGFDLPNGKLTIQASDISFGQTFAVKEDMEVRDTTISTMPTHLSVGGDLTLDELCVDRWPDVMDIKGAVNQGHVSEISVENVTPALT